MTVENFVINMGPDVYYSDKFRDVLEDHMTYLRTHPETGMTVITPGEANQWQGDFFGLLQDKGRPAHLHWLIMRMNGYTSPLQFTSDMIAFIEPNPAVVDRIRQASASAARIS